MHYALKLIDLSMNIEQMDQWTMKLAQMNQWTMDKTMNET